MFRYLLILLALVWLMPIPLFAQKSLQPQAMQKDLATLKATWENLHAGIYRYNNRDQIDAEFHKAAHYCSIERSLRDFYLLVAQLNAQVHCSHSYVNYYNNKKVIREALYSPVYLPLLFRVLDGKFILTHNLDFNLLLEPGQEIVAINNIPVRLICDSLMTVARADGNNGLKKKYHSFSVQPTDIGIKKYCLFDIYFPLFFKQNLMEENFWVSVKQGRRVVSIKMKGLSKAQREQAYLERYGPLEEQEKSWNTRELTASTVLLRLGDFSTYNWKIDFKHYLDSVFGAFRLKAYKNLIVDIRENEGGSDETRDYVLSYLCKKTIPCASPLRRLYRYTHVIDSLKPNLSSWDDSFLNDKVGYKQVEAGYYEADAASVSCDSIVSAANHFTGTIFLITDVSNSSATFVMADCFKKNQLGITVGEQTGGSRQGINGGQLLFFNLPESGIEMDIPLIWQKPLEPQPDEGIVPDYVVPTTAKSIAAHEDVQLKFILKNLLR